MTCNFIIENLITIYHQWLLPDHIFNVPLTGPSDILLHTLCNKYYKTSIFITPTAQTEYGCQTVNIEVCIKHVTQNMPCYCLNCMSYCLVICKSVLSISNTEGHFTDDPWVMRLPWWAWDDAVPINMCLASHSFLLKYSRGESYAIWVVKSGVFHECV